MIYLDWQLAGHPKIEETLAQCKRKLISRTGRDHYGNAVKVIGPEDPLPPETEHTRANIFFFALETFTEEMKNKYNNCDVNVFTINKHSDTSPVTDFINRKVEEDLQEILQLRPQAYRIDAKKFAKLDKPSAEPELEKFSEYCANILKTTLLSNIKELSDDDITVRESMNEDTPGTFVVEVHKFAARFAPKDLNDLNDVLKYTNLCDFYQSLLAGKTFDAALKQHDSEEPQIGSSAAAIGARGLTGSPTNPDDDGAHAAPNQEFQPITPSQ